MAIFVSHGPCNKCGSRDNLATYSDGGQFCFGCGKTTPSSVSGFVHEAQQEDEEEPTWVLPDDLTQNFPEEILNYAKQYTIGTSDLIKYGYFYSSRTRLLWRVFRPALNHILGNGDRSSKGSAEVRRIFSGSGPKARFYGSKEVYPIAGTQSPCRTLVLTEDSFSSIVVGRVCDAMPLFGTSISTTKVVHVAKDYQQVVVWLDHDKFKEAWDIALRFKWLGLNTKVVLTKLDPKCFSEQEIKEYLK